MSVALFHRALPGTADGLPVLICGVADGPVMVLVINDDGTFGWVEPHRLVADWRYDHRKQEWIDVADAGEPHDEIPGSQEVPSDFPDSDGADDSGEHPGFPGPGDVDTAGRG